MSVTTCPCGSGREFAACCGPVIAGTVPAATAEALMRSRYSAYVTHNVEYIVQSCTAEQGRTTDVEATRTWAEGSEWMGLQILSTEKGLPGDSEGIVEFVASYQEKGKSRKVEHHEKAYFVKEGGKWLYADGREVPRTVVRTEPKVGRNDPCPCGSGKKFKQCHGR